MFYCYIEEECVNVIKEFSLNLEIICFKGLGEILFDEFRYFIGKDMCFE